VASRSRTKDQPGFCGDRPVSGSPRKTSSNTDPVAANPEQAGPGQKNSGKGFQSTSQAVSAEGMDRRREEAMLLKLLVQA